MRFFHTLVLGCLSVLFFTSCVRSSTVVRVKKDGSGSIVSRYYFSPEMLAMIDQLGAFGGAIEGVTGGADLGLIREMSKPEEESLRKDAANYGEGVRYSIHEPGKDEEGWEGYSVVYEFDDIRKVRIDRNSVPGKAKEFVESSGQAEAVAGKGGDVSFELSGDTLTINTNFGEGGMDAFVDEEQLKKAAEMGMKPSEAVKMASGMTGGMRVGFFVRFESGILETDAAHVNGDLITLSDADVSKVLADPDFGTFIDRVSDDPASVTEASMKELIGEIEALTMETSDEVTVKMK